MLVVGHQLGEGDAFLKGPGDVFQGFRGGSGADAAGRNGSDEARLRSVLEGIKTGPYGAGDLAAHGLGFRVL